MLEDREWGYVGESEKAFLIVLNESVISSMLHGGTCSGHFFFSKYQNLGKDLHPNKFYFLETCNLGDHPQKKVRFSLFILFPDIPKLTVE